MSSEEDKKAQSTRAEEPSVQSTGGKPSDVQPTDVGVSNAQSSAPCVKHQLTTSKDPFVHAAHIGLKNPIGSPFSDVTLDAYRGEVFAICGRDGSGKTSLLLTLAGRMRSTSGELTVGGFPLPKKRRDVQKLVGLGVFTGLNDLRESLKVRYAVASELELYGLKHTSDFVERVLNDWRLLPYADERVLDLTASRKTRLGCCLATLGKVKMVVIDDIESQLALAQSEKMLDELKDKARALDMCVVVGCIERTLAAQADRAYYLPDEGGQKSPLLAAVETHRENKARNAAQRAQLEEVR